MQTFKSDRTPKVIKQVGKTIKQNPETTVQCTMGAAVLIAYIFFFGHWTTNLNNAFIERDQRLITDLKTVNENVNGTKNNISKLKDIPKDSKELVLRYDEDGYRLTKTLSAIYKEHSTDGDSLKDFIQKEKILESDMFMLK